MPTLKRRETPRRDLPEAASVANLTRRNAARKEANSPMRIEQRANGELARVPSERIRSARASNDAGDVCRTKDRGAPPSVNDLVRPFRLTGIPHLARKLGGRERIATEYRCYRARHHLGPIAANVDNIAYPTRGRK